MTLRPPERFTANAGAASSPIEVEIAAEKASALGRAGERVEKALASLRAAGSGSTERSRRLQEAVDAVYGYFIQRELCGLRRHDQPIRDYSIPAEVLVRLGAR